MKIVPASPPIENTCTPIGTLPMGYAGLDLTCTQASTCSDVGAVCAAGYSGTPSPRACSANAAPFDASTGCTGIGC